ncbi:hypothetical protein TGAMA5MH_01056 [Trichoderma gamsii]|nr:hypothetical protein TGAMA5MH_01056 [Trichoderma gamsii]
MSFSRILASIKGAVSRDTYKYSAIPEQLSRRPSSRRQRSSESAALAASSQGREKLIKMSLGGMALFAILLTTVSLG